jgi:hypothetical protein
MRRSASTPPSSTKPPIDAPPIISIPPKTHAAIDVADWRRHTEYLGEYARLGERHRVIRWFWEAVTHTLDEAQRARLLQFTTGGGSVPAQGFKGLQSNDGHFRRFNVQSVRRQDSSFPRAHTCFNKCVGIRGCMHACVKLSGSGSLCAFLPQPSPPCPPLSLAPPPPPFFTQHTQQTTTQAGPAAVRVQGGADSRPAACMQHGRHGDRFHHRLA